MDITKELAKLIFYGKRIELLELLEKNKDVLYPPDYYMWSSIWSPAEEQKNSLAKLRQSMGEEDILHKLFYKLEAEYSVNEISGLIDYILHNPPKNVQLEELRVDASNKILEAIDIYEQIIDESQNFDVSKENKDGNIHIDYSLPIWLNYYRSRMSDYQAMYHFVMIEPKEMILSAEHTVELCTGELQNSIYMSNMMTNLALYYRINKDLEKGLETRLLSIEILEDPINKFGYYPRDGEGIVANIISYISLGYLLMMVGDLLNAEKYYKRFLDLSGSGWAHLHMAIFYINSGDLVKAEKHLEEANNKFDPNSKGHLAQCLTEKARINHLTGSGGASEINSAIELIEKHLEEKEYSTSDFAIKTFFRVADYYMANLDFVKAKKYYSKVSEMCKIICYRDLERAECLMKLIQIACIEGEETEFYKRELDHLVVEFSGHEKMVMYQQLAEAIILKHSKGIQRGASRFKAQDIFGKISHGKIYDINLNIFAKFNYCDLLIDAYQFYGDDEIFEELSNEVQNLTSISEEKGLILYHIDALILRSKIVTMQNDLESALEYLEEASVLADTRNLKIYQDRIKAEKETYLQNLDSWNSMVKGDKIEKLRLKQYLKFAQQNITK